MRKLPIALCLYSSTKGHFGRRTDWRLTLDHWDRQVPLSLFGQLIVHVKVKPGEEALAAEMAAELTARGFHVIQTVGGWGRGMSHQSNYMADVITVSNERRLYTQPYYLHLEDDSAMLAGRVSLEDWLVYSCRLLAEDHELMTVRVMRRGDARGPETAPKDDPRWFYSADTNLQPLLMRTSTLYLLGLLLERNPEACQQVQCEALWRILLDSLTRSQKRHLVWECDEIETVHIGVPDPAHSAAVRSMGLTPYPIPTL